MNDYIKNVCKVEETTDRCKYLMLDLDGFMCGKVSPSRTFIEGYARILSGQAKGDNCEGKKDLDSLTSD